MRVAIIGAGIGGLAVAAALHQRGFAADVYEQADKFARVGAGLQQSPNAVKVHRGLGVEDRVRQVANRPASSLNRDGITGAVTNDHPLGEAVESRYGAPYLTMHRGDLHEALLSVVPGECIHLGHKLTNVTGRGPRAELSFGNGSEIEADLVIGADGVHSLIREHVVGPDQARFTGRVAYRTTYPLALLRGVEMTTSRTKWWGPDRHIVIYLVTPDEIYFTTSTPERADWISRESWSTKGDLGELRAAFADFHADVRAVLAASPEVHKWGIFERAPLPTWRRGRVVLLGDACHPMTPKWRRAPAWRWKMPPCWRAASKTSPASILRCGYTKTPASRAPRRCSRVRAPTTGCATRPIRTGSTATTRGPRRSANRSRHRAGAIRF